MLELQVERVKRAASVSEVVIATADTPADSAIVDEARRIGVPSFAGDENDVLSRYVGVARERGMTALIRLTGDCPLSDPAVIDFTIRRFYESAADYCSNGIPRSVPDGLDVEVFTRDALEKTNTLATQKADREHVTRFIYTNPSEFKVVASAPEDTVLGHHRWTLDTIYDFELIKEIFEALYPQNPRFGMAEILEYMANHPEAESRLRDGLATMKGAQG